ncbi:hypothetical protein NC651_000842 [Populus alba x Populus x berolinensis]|nr:hypothetical protein NC651_000842 [Populus alba x Populus x berolinensis]
MRRKIFWFYSLVANIYVSIQVKTNNSHQDFVLPNLGTAGAIYTVNPSISAQMNLPPLAIPGSSQSSNISNADHEKRLRKQESDRKSRAKKEQMRRENEERLAKVTEENNELRKDNATLKDGEVKMKRTLKNFEQKVSHFEKEVGRLNNKLKGQNTKVDVLSEKLTALAVYVMDKSGVCDAVSFWCLISYHIKTHLMSYSKFSDANGAVINENTSLNAALIKNVRKRMAGMNKQFAKYKNANTSLVKENVYLKNRQAWMTKSQKRQKKTLVYLKHKYNELTDKATGLSNLLMESYAQLQERNTELEASNAQLRERNAVLENESNARDEVNKENGHELDQAKI